MRTLKTSTTKMLVSKCDSLSDYYGGASITHSDHWSHYEYHIDTKFYHWFYLQQFGIEFLS